MEPHMPDFLNGPELLQRLRGKLPQAQKADLAVAFWGSGAAQNLGLQDCANVRIICNLMSGATNPKEVRTLLERGAKVRQLNDLHAKIGVIDDMSFVGSSNMSTNGLGSEDSAARWQEANVVYGNARPEISEMFAEFWNAGTKISEADLKAAMLIWAARKKANAAVAARHGGRSLVNVLRTAPADLDALNVRMVVYDTVTDPKLICDLGDADKIARKRYGDAFMVYREWHSMTTDARTAYLVDYDWPSEREIVGGGIYRRNVEDFPDFEHEGKVFHPCYKIKSIEGITFSRADRNAIKKAFHAYVEAGARGEAADGRIYNFPVSELAQYLPPNG